MSVSEQELFGLMAIAREQQEAAAAQIAALVKQRTELAATIAQAQRAIEAMQDAGAATAGLIERAAKLAVGKAVSDALEGVSKATSDALAVAVAPEMKAIRGAAAEAQRATDSLNRAGARMGWRHYGLAVVTGLVSALMVSAVWLKMSPPTVVNQLDAEVVAEYLKPAIKDALKPSKGK